MVLLSQVAVSINDRGKASHTDLPEQCAPINMPTFPTPQNQALIFRHSLSEMTALRHISNCVPDLEHSAQETEESQRALLQPQAQ